MAFTEPFLGWSWCQFGVGRIADGQVWDACAHGGGIVHFEIAADEELTGHDCGRRIRCLGVVLVKMLWCVGRELGGERRSGVRLSDLVGLRFGGAIDPLASFKYISPALK